MSLQSHQDRGTLPGQTLPGVKQYLMQYLMASQMIMAAAETPKTI